MLQIANDWNFTLDSEKSRIWLTVKGTWGMEIACVTTKVPTSDRLGATFAPKLVVRDLDFDGLDWRELVGVEIYQQEPWAGEGAPFAEFKLLEESDVFDAAIRVTGFEGTSLLVEIEAVVDVYYDAEHDKEVPLRFSGRIPFQGVQFRFRAEGAASRDPARRARELLAQHLAPDGFELPRVTPVEPGIFDAFFPPRQGDDDEPPTREIRLDDEDDDEDDEARVLRQSAKELLLAMVKQEWVEMEEGVAIESMTREFVVVLETGGHGVRRAKAVSEWLMGREEVVELHMDDDDLAKVLDRYW